MTDAQKIELLRLILWRISEKMLTGTDEDNPNWTKDIYYEAYEALRDTADDPENYEPRIVTIILTG